MVAEWRLFKLDGSQYPPPMIVEIYIDLADLNRGQNLVILDEEKEKRYNVADAFSNTTSNLRPSSRSGSAQHIILERWEFSLDETADGSGPDKLPEIYKKSIPLFRALYSYTHQLPAWQYRKRMVKSSADHPSLKLRYRIFNGQFKSPRSDTLETPLYRGQVNITESYTFAPWRIPVGDMSISLTYRTNCNFKIAGTESLLSSQFKGQDDRYNGGNLSDRQTGGVPSSLPTVKREMALDDQNKGQVYGSLATFHRMGPAPGTSPISALRAAREVGSYSPSDPAMASLPTASQKTTLDRKSSLRQEAAPSIPRRQSVSFQPFKAGSLASSPGLQPPPSPGSSVGRTSGLDPLSRARHRHSLSSQTLPQAAQRIPGSVQDTAIASSGSSSPRPAPINRYSSSFGHRRTRLSIGGSASKGEDDQNSSGKQSTSSSTKREGSDVLAEGATGGSSGSIPNAQKEEDDDLKDFIRLLEAKKDIKLNRPNAATAEASMRRTTAALSKYRGMREETASLGDSLSSSLMMHRSSSSSNPSQKLNAVPGMVPGSTMSIGSSPGKPISPHTPHTPAVPSRLSANEVLDYGEMPRRSRSRGIRTHEEVADDVGSDSTARDTAAMGAIDIPTSPRAWPFVRRSSSVSQQNRVPLDDEPELFGLRSSSLPGAVEDRPEISMSELARLTEDLNLPSALPRIRDDPESGQAQQDRPPYLVRELSGEDSSTLPSTEAPYSLAARQTTRYRGFSRGSPLYGAMSSVSASASASASASVSDSRQTGPTGESRGRFGSSRSSLAHRPSSDRDLDEDEPAMFQMSDIANSSRRSLEQGRGDGAAGQTRGSTGTRGGWR